MIEVREIFKSLGGRPVLEGVTLTVQPGEVVALFGPNGAGKTTLLRLIAGLARPDQGDVRVEGHQPHLAPGEWRQRWGFLAHQPYVYEGLTGEENLEFWARIYRVPDARRRIRALLASFGLTLAAGDPVRSYSRGMVQRLALARVLLPDPVVLLLDEPFTGLDAAGAKALEGTLEELKARGRTLLVVSHRPEEVAEVADRALLLQRGRVLGEPGAVQVQAERPWPQAAAREPAGPLGAAEAR